MEKVENQLNWQNEYFNLRRLPILGVFGTIILISLAMYSIWTSSMPREEAFWGSVFVVAIGIIGIAVFLFIYFLKVRAKKGLVNLEKELGGDQCH